MEWRANADDVQAELGPEVLVVRSQESQHRVEGLILKDEQGREVAVRVSGRQLEVKVDRRGR